MITVVEISDTGATIKGASSDNDLFFFFTNLVIKYGYLNIYT